MQGKIVLMIEVERSVCKRRMSAIPFEESAKPRGHFATLSLSG